MKKTAIALILLSLTSAPAFASCMANESALMDRINNLTVQAHTLSGCQGARALQQIYSELLNFYTSCPASDPTNQMAPQIRNALSVANQQAAAVCS